MTTPGDDALRGWLYRSIKGATDRMRTPWLDDQVSAEGPDVIAEAERLLREEGEGGDGEPDPRLG